MPRSNLLQQGFAFFACFFLISSPLRFSLADEQDASAVIEKLGIHRGIIVVLGPGNSNMPIRLAESSEFQIFFQTQNENEVVAVRTAAESKGLLGTRVFVEQGSAERIHLASNLADGLIVSELDTDSTDEATIRQEVERVLHPGAKGIIGDQTIVAKAPAGVDDWSHPYHGPDNNPQSRDQTARAPYLTQFLCEPWYVPMPQVTVAAGGRVFKAFGHIALKEREWPWLNSLVAINGYNGTLLWKRPLQPDFMIHRNTMAATADILYLADSKSCKLIDAETGELQDEIVIPTEIDADGVWKWMALVDGTLYAMVGEKEAPDDVIRGTRTEAGWPWSGLGRAYGGNYQWGFGRTLLAVAPKSKQILWTYESAQPLDSRATCMASGRIYTLSHQNFLACIDSKSGQELWKSTDEKLLAAIGQHDRAQTANKGFASSSYVKANANGIFFAGPQRKRLVAASTADGSFMWDYNDGNFQLVLRDEGLYAMGRMQTSKLFDYTTGNVLADLECYRGNCTRATGTVDSIFTRGYRHTGTMRLDLSASEPKRIPLMRPACQDGVIVADGHLYWGPWMCDCNHSLVGMIALAPAGDFDFSRQATEGERLQVDEMLTPVQKLLVQPEDWPAYRSGPARRSAALVAIPSEVSSLWECDSPGQAEPTAPVAVGNLVFLGGLDGVVRAVDAGTGEVEWLAYTGGAIRFPPEIWNGRLFVGSGDGCVYCFEAASGKRLWRFRAAPDERRIAVHGRLLSTWPVGSGVLVHDGVVYAAAGISSYDGTFVYALDASTGKIHWQNSSSGRLTAHDEVTGVSVQGHLLLHGRKLYMAGGNVISPAVYDIENGACLNHLQNEWWDRAADAAEKFPSRPNEAMFQRSPRGRELFVVDGEVRVFDQLLYSPPQYGPSRYFGGHYLQAESDAVVIRATFGQVVRLHDEQTADGQPIGRWRNTLFQDPRAIAVCKNAIVVAGIAKSDGKPVPAVASLSLSDGELYWMHQLDVAPVNWGLAITRSGGIIVALVDGRAVCLDRTH